MMNAQTRFQTIALKIVGVLLIAVGINQLVGVAQSRWNRAQSNPRSLIHSWTGGDACPWGDHGHRALRIEVHDARAWVRDVEADVRVTMESVREDLDAAHAEMEAARDEIHVEMRQIR